MSKTVIREVILAKIEATYNTDPVPVEGTDAMLVGNASWAFEGVRMNERTAVRGTLGMLPQVYGGALKTVSFDAEVKGSGAAGTAPEIGPLLRACGLDETIVASTSVTYAPVSTGHESITIYYYQDGQRHILTGCRGNVSFSMEAGGIVKGSFTFTGHSVNQTDTALASPTYNALVPEPYLNAAFTIDGYSAAIAALSFDLGNQLAMPADVSAVDGYSDIQIVSRDVNGSFDPEMTTEAVEAWEANFRSGALMALAAGSFGSAGNIVSITMPEVYYREIAPGDRDGIRTYDISFGSVDVTTADSEVSIAFT